MKSIASFFLILIAVLSLTACKTPYTPTPTTTVSNYLVVEGSINISDSTIIKLSRTVNLTSSKVLNPELKAVITIESNTGSSYPLTDVGSGTYAAPSFNLSSTNQYRLRIKTSSGSQYLSDFNDTKVSPAIDSVSWAAGNDLKLYVSTHDITNNTRYYRWDFTEAWEFHPNYNSQFISDGLQILLRTPAQQIWDCFTGDGSTVINIGTSVKLGKDVISQNLINTIPSDAEKISVKYSILVKQYALTLDAYNYWTLLKKNTEQLGSIFDSQPSSSIGNIHSLTNPNEPVIGYISSGTVTMQRIFITRQQLPNWLTTLYYPKCGTDIAYLYPPPPKTQPPLWSTEDELLNYNSSEFQGQSALQIPISALPSATNPAYLSAYPYCVDCTLRGSKTPPFYWK